MKVVRAIEANPTKPGDKPIKPVEIVACGEIKIETPYSLEHKEL